MRNTQQFTASFNKAVEQAMGDAEAIYSLGCDMMFDSVIVGQDAPHTVVSHNGTPVDTGFARASWWKSVGSVGSHPNPPTPVEKGETVSGSTAVGQSLGKLKLSDTVFLSNNADYILRLEYGHSSQARNPDGMVRITLAQAKEFWELAKKELAKGRARQ